LSLLVTAGQRGDSPQLTPVIEAIRVPLRQLAVRYQATITIAAINIWLPHI
jgi:hypothetical protein